MPIQELPLQFRKTVSTVQVPSDGAVELRSERFREIVPCQLVEKTRGGLSSVRTSFVKSVE